MSKIQSHCQKTYYEVTLTSTFQGVSDVSYTDTPIGTRVVTDHSAFNVAKIISLKIVVISVSYRPNVFLCFG